MSGYEEELNKIISHSKKQNKAVLSFYESSVELLVFILKKHFVTKEDEKCPYGVKVFLKGVEVKLSGNVISDKRRVFKLLENQ